jgi:hypothetical protein
MVRPKSLKVRQLITQAQFVVGLELVAVAGPANALQVLTAVRIADLQSPDESRRHNVIHMTAHPSLLEVNATGLYFAFPT